MPDTPPQVLLDVSANLRQARQTLGWSQDKLATAAGVSRRMLVNIEAGDSNVSLATLDRLAAALGLSFAELVRPPAANPRQPAAPVTVWQGRHADSHASLLQSLGSAGRTVELWLWQLAAGERYDAEADPAGSHEMLYVIAGELELERAGTRQRLGPGDSLTFASDERYAYLNPGAVPVRFTKNVLLAR
ncbi:helix-turn-helix domain-containing protein [Pseudogulbenkiania subflava]|uniref:Transcriptional regulator, XRE family with cupin sensor n=1 Tax=Pseudogulbenkiania subflava DSM 22618 TaxID=1123014 RepID=A0A1Y6BBB4_9NEIS|nr:XRE family transcriptional regulator [Pseudogulbenkiania subflava]SME94520.1 transcriptional regulator, XRE family with cupin sensor [Pseudogulbenkiania subflava DSM 22618]